MKKKDINNQSLDKIIIKSKLILRNKKMLNYKNMADIYVDDYDPKKLQNLI